MAGRRQGANESGQHAMVYLIISILSMSLLAVVLRLSMQQGAGALGVNTVFRGTAAVVMVAVALFSVDITATSDLLATVGLRACLAAFFFFLAGFASIKAVQLGPLGTGWTVLRCSMILPVLASLFVWREIPLFPMSKALILRMSGVFLCFLAVVLLGMGRRQKESSSNTSRNRAWFIWLSIAFLSQGAWDVVLRSTRILSDNDARMLFVAVAFAGAFCFSLPAMVAVKERLGRKELGYGLPAGLLGLLASGTKVWALRDIDGVIVFPVSTVSVMLLVQLSAVGIWREKTGRIGWLGFATALGGVLLLTSKG